MDIQTEKIAACGLYCGVCKIHIATQENDLNYLNRITRIYKRHFPELAHVTADDLLCDGCRSIRKSVLCRQCSIRECNQGKGFIGCIECDDFPCTFIDQFKMPVGKKVILRAIPYWRIHGTEQFVLAEVQRYRCPDCGGKLFRGAKQCPDCKIPVDVD